MRKARRVLLSGRALQSLRDPLRELQQALAASGSDVFEPVTLDTAIADPSIDVHAAFISRDITGVSTKTVLTPTLEATYVVLRRSPELRWVHTHSAGSDRPIYPELRARSVAVTTSAGANAAVVAQTALMGVLALSRRLPDLMQAQRERRWAPLVARDPLPPDLAGQTAVIVGWGAIGRHLQSWLAMLGVQTIVVRRSDTPAAEGIETVRFDALRRVLPRADWLILACPLNAQTRHLIDAAALQALKPGAMLVNVARGEVVDEPALIEVLGSGHVAGACLDVFEIEPLAQDSPLWELPQVIVMPHSAGFAAGNAARVEKMFVDNLARWLGGRELVNAVD